MMGSWIGIALKEVGGASVSGALEAEGQEFVALCLSEAILKRSAPRARIMLFRFDTQYSNIPSFHGVQFLLRARFSDLPESSK
jgi:hypothetical protein